jgi:glycosyltransferase involved in cell wall biosynthesis
MPATIKIALDCRDINIATTGTHTYLSELIAAFNEQHNNQVSFVYIKPFIGVMPGNNAFAKLIRHFQFFFYKQITLPILTFINGASVLICTDYVVPVFTPGFKTIVVFHDAFFWEYPLHYSALWLRIFKSVALAGAKKSVAVIAPSEYAKKQIALHTGINAAHINVVYEAPKTFAQINPQSPAQTNSQPAQSIQSSPQISAPYFLHVGTLAKHKNLPLLIEAFSKLDKHLKLVLVGGAPSSVHNSDVPNIKAAIQKHNLQNQVVLTGYLSNAEVASWYANALGYVFPSYNEGFGLPILEAMQYKLPIIAANNTCLPEIAQGGALYFDPTNTDQLAVQMQAIVTNTPAVTATLDAQPAVLQQFSWDKAAASFVALALDGLKNASKHA